MCALEAGSPEADRITAWTTGNTVGDPLLAKAVAGLPKVKGTIYRGLYGVSPSTLRGLKGKRLDIPYHVSGTTSKCVGINFARGDEAGTRHEEFLDEAGNTTTAVLLHLKTRQAARVGAHVALGYEHQKEHIIPPGKFKVTKIKQGRAQAIKKLWHVHAKEFSAEYPGVPDFGGFMDPTGKVHSVNGSHALFAMHKGAPKVNDDHVTGLIHKGWARISANGPELNVEVHRDHYSKLKPHIMNIWSPGIDKALMGSRGTKRLLLDVHHPDRMVYQEHLNEQHYKHAQPDSGEHMLKSQFSADIPPTNYGYWLSLQGKWHPVDDSGHVTEGKKILSKIDPKANSSGFNVYDHLIHKHGYARIVHDPYSTIIDSSPQHFNTHKPRIARLVNEALKDGKTPIIAIRGPANGMIRGSETPHYIKSHGDFAKLQFATNPSYLGIGHYYKKGNAHLWWMDRGLPGIKYYKLTAKTWNTTHGDLTPDADVQGRIDHTKKMISVSHFIDGPNDHVHVTRRKEWAEKQLGKKYPDYQIVSDFGKANSLDMWRRNRIVGVEPTTSGHRKGNSSRGLPDSQRSWSKGPDSDFCGYSPSQMFAACDPSWLSIGHHKKGKVNAHLWWYHEGHVKAKKLTATNWHTSHSQEGVDGALAMGRIDHTRKQISFRPSFDRPNAGEHAVEMSAKILAKKFPDYEHVHEFGDIGRSGQSWRVAAAEQRGRSMLKPLVGKGRRKPMNERGKDVSWFSVAPSEILYHGGKDLKRTKIVSRKPMFLTPEREGAEWYSYLSHDGKHQNSMNKVSITHYKPAGLADVHKAASDLHISTKDIIGMPNRKNGELRQVQTDESEGGDTLFPFDQVYHPAIRRHLRKQGFDVVKGSDILSNGEIPIAIPLHPRRQVKVLGSYQHGNKPTFASDFFAAGDMARRAQLRKTFPKVYPFTPTKLGKYLAKQELSYKITPNISLRKVKPHIVDENTHHWQLIHRKTKNILHRFHLRGGLNYSPIPSVKYSFGLKDAGKRFQNRGLATKAYSRLAKHYGMIVSDSSGETSPAAQKLYQRAGATRLTRSINEHDRDDVPGSVHNSYRRSLYLLRGENFAHDFFAAGDMARRAQLKKTFPSTKNGPISSTGALEAAVKPARYDVAPGVVLQKHPGRYQGIDVHRWELRHEQSGKRLHTYTVQRNRFDKIPSVQWSFGIENHPDFYKKGLPGLGYKLLAKHYGMIKSDSHGESSYDARRMYDRIGGTLLTRTRDNALGLKPNNHSLKNLRVERSKYLLRGENFAFCSPSELA